MRRSPFLLGNGYIDRGDLHAWNLEKLLSFCFDDEKGLKKGAGPLVFVMLHLDSLQGRREGGGFGQ
jgi:hypothetical protein